MGTRLRGFLCTLGRLVRRLRCPHSRTFKFFPDEVWWSRDGKNQGKVTHGLKVTCCVDCGEVWAEDYAE